MEKVLGFREPEEFDAATRVFFGVVLSAVLVLSVLAVMDAQTLALALIRLAPSAVLVALIVQGAGNLFYRKNRRLSAILRVVARLVVTPALMAIYVVLIYAADGA